MSIGRRVVPLFDFANHAPNWLEEIAKTVKDEPWGNNYKVLEIYLRSNFEIAKLQGKVIEKEDFAIWKPGYLVSNTMDPVSLYYEKNTYKDKQKWNFKEIKIGEHPVDDIDTFDLNVKYEPPEFNPKWEIYIEQSNFDHVLTTNKDRLLTIFGDSESSNTHRLFRTIYGEIMLARKEAAGVIAQWYKSSYNFLMPLCLTEPNKVDLTAALTIDETMKRYQLRTLLLPHYAYANARSLVKSRSQFGAWISLDDKVLNTATYDDSNDSD